MLNSKTTKKLLIIEYELNNSIRNKIRKDLNNYHIVDLHNNFINQDSINEFNVTHAHSFVSTDFEELIDNESSIASRKWLTLTRASNNDFPFIYKNIDLSIPIIHTMGVGIYPETFFHGLIRGYRLAEIIIKSIKPDKVIIMDSNSPVIIGFKLAAFKKNNIDDYSVSCIKKYKIIIIINNLYMSIIKPLLQLSRDIYYALKNIVYSKIKNNIEKKGLLYFPHHFNRVRLVEPVLTELTRRNIEIKIVFNNNDKHYESLIHKTDNTKKLQAVIKKSQFHNSRINDYLNFSIIYNLIKIKLLISINNINNHEYDSNDDITLIVNKTFSEAYKHYIYNSHYGIVRTVEILMRIIDVEHPKLLLFNTDEANTAKLAALIGQENNIPVVNMDHGIQIDSPRISDLLFTKMAVSGSYNKNIFIKCGAKESQVEITGMPIHDSIYNKLCEPVNYSLLKELGLDLANKNILLLTHPYTRSAPNHIRIQILRVMLQAIKKLSRVNLIIKLHPNESDGIAKSEADNSLLKNVAVITNLDYLYDLLRLCDVAVTSYNSTTAIEAVLFDKPLLILNLTGFDNTINSARQGVAIEIKETEKVYESLNELLHNQDILSSLQINRKQYIEKNAYKLDGRSSSRVSDLTQELIES
jgi:UDP-N-acetylglucosamine 2-epimerase